MKQSLKFYFALFFGLITNQSLACDSTVSTAEDLNIQINNYNNLTSGDLTVCLSADIELQTIIDVPPAPLVFPTPLIAINNSFPGPRLFIQSDSDQVLRTIDALDQFQILKVLDGNVRFDRIKFKDGKTISSATQDRNGAALHIASGAFVTVSQSEFVSNVVTDTSQFAEVGGAIFNDGSLNVFSSLFRNNTATNNGGAINNGPNGDLLIVASTFSNNSVAASSGRGGAVNNVSTGTANISQSTFSGNTQNGFDNGLVNDGGTLTLRSNLFADGCEVSSGSSTTNDGNNLFPVVSNDRSCGFSDGANGTVITSQPILGTLADNGGLTDTIALLENSPAIDTGLIDFINTTDQRGFTRLNGPPDIGAFELVQDDVFEPNETRETATIVNSPSVFTGLTMKEGDEDFFRVRLPANKEARFSVFFEDIFVDIDIRLLDENGNTLASSTSVSDDEEILFTPTEAGTFFLRVYEFSTNFDHYYDLEIDFEEDELCFPIIGQQGMAVICL